MLKLNALNIHGVQPFSSFFKLKSNFIVLSDFVDQTCYVYEILLT